MPRRSPLFDTMPSLTTMVEDMPFYLDRMDEARISLAIYFAVPVSLQPSPVVAPPANIAPCTVPPVGPLPAIAPVVALPSTSVATPVVADQTTASTPPHATSSFTSTASSSSSIITVSSNASTSIAASSATSDAEDVQNTAELGGPKEDAQAADALPVLASAESSAGNHAM